MIEAPSASGWARVPDEFPPLPAAGQGSGSFGALMRETRSEVERYIATGEGGMTAQLSPEARVAMLRAQGPASAQAPSGASDSQARAFLDEILPLAREAGRSLGVSADLVAAHAALESAWGSKPLRGKDGASRYNLFGIKADSGWQGQSALAMTREAGEAAAPAAFRAYGSLAEGFGDYQRFLSSNPRYRSVLGSGDNVAAFAKGLARAGYATDPAYADKLVAVAGKVRALLRQP